MSKRGRGRPASVSASESRISDHGTSVTSSQPPAASLIPAFPQILAPSAASRDSSTVRKRRGRGRGRGRPPGSRNRDTIARERAGLAPDDPGVAHVIENGADVYSGFSAAFKGAMAETKDPEPAMPEKRRGFKAREAAMKKRLGYGKAEPAAVAASPLDGEPSDYLSEPVGSLSTLQLPPPAPTAGAVSAAHSSNQPQLSPDALSSYRDPFQGSGPLARPLFHASNRLTAAPPITPATASSNSIATPGSLPKLFPSMSPDASALGSAAHSRGSTATAADALIGAAFPGGRLHSGALIGGGSSRQFQSAAIPPLVPMASQTPSSTTSFPAPGVSMPHSAPGSRSAAASHNASSMPISHTVLRVHASLLAQAASAAPTAASLVPVSSATQAASSDALLSQGAPGAPLLYGAPPARSAPLAHTTLIAPTPFPQISSSSGSQPFGSGSDSEGSPTVRRPIARPVRRRRGGTELAPLSPTHARISMPKSSNTSARTSSATRRLVCPPMPVPAPVPVPLQPMPVPGAIALPAPTPASVAAPVLAPAFSTASTAAISTGRQQPLLRALSLSTHVAPTSRNVHMSALSASRPLPSPLPHASLNAGLPRASLTLPISSRAPMASPAPTLTPGLSSAHTSTPASAHVPTPTSGSSAHHPIGSRTTLPSHAHPATYHAPAPSTRLSHIFRAAAPARASMPLAQSHMGSISTTSAPAPSLSPALQILGPALGLGISSSPSALPLQAPLLVTPVASFSALDSALVPARRTAALTKASTNSSGSSLSVTVSSTGSQPPAFASVPASLARGPASFAAWGTAASDKATTFLSALIPPLGHVAGRQPSPALSSATAPISAPASSLGPLSAIGRWPDTTPADSVMRRGTVDSRIWSQMQRPAEVQRLSVTQKLSATQRLSASQKRPASSRSSSVQRLSVQMNSPAVDFSHKDVFDHTISPGQCLTPEPQVSQQVKRPSRRKPVARGASAQYSLPAPPVPVPVFPSSVRSSPQTSGRATPDSVQSALSNAVGTRAILRGPKEAYQLLPVIVSHGSAQNSLDPSQRGKINSLGSSQLEKSSAAAERADYIFMTEGSDTEGTPDIKPPRWPGLVDSFDLQSSSHHPQPSSDKEDDLVGPSLVAAPTIPTVPTGNDMAASAKERSSFTAALELAQARRLSAGVLASPAPLAGPQRLLAAENNDDHSANSHVHGATGAAVVTASAALGLVSQEQEQEQYNTDSAHAAPPNTPKKTPTPSRGGKSPKSQRASPNTGGKFTNTGSDDHETSDSRIQLAKCNSPARLPHSHTNSSMRSYPPARSSSSLSSSNDDFPKPGASQGSATPTTEQDEDVELDGDVGVALLPLLSALDARDTHAVDFSQWQCQTSLSRAHSGAVGGKSAGAPLGEISLQRVPLSAEMVSHLVKAGASSPVDLSASSPPGKNYTSANCPAFLSPQARALVSSKLSAASSSAAGQTPCSCAAHQIAPPRAVAPRTSAEDLLAIAKSSAQVSDMPLHQRLNISASQRAESEHQNSAYSIQFAPVPVRASPDIAMFMAQAGHSPVPPRRTPDLVQALVINRPQSANQNAALPVDQSAESPKATKRPWDAQHSQNESEAKRPRKTIHQMT